MKLIDWTRVLRTAVQAAAGAGITFLAALTIPLEVEALSVAAIQFVITVATAILMNIQKQTEER